MGREIDGFLVIDWNEERDRTRKNIKIQNVPNGRASRNTNRKTNEKIGGSSEFHG